MSEETNLPFAEDVNYWRTGRSAPDTFVEKAKRQIEDAGGTIEREAFGSETSTGRSAFMLEFSFNGSTYKTVWPVLQTKCGDDAAARRQAATFLYHDVKAKCMVAKVLGHRVAFFGQTLLPDGRMALQLSASNLEKAMPKLLGHK